LGELTRTNSEVNLFATSRTRTDLAEGIVGTSSIHPDVHTHIEAFRHGKGSNLPYLLNTTLVNGDKHRFANWVLTNMRHPGALARTFNVRRASERTLMLLVMQDLDNSLTTYLKGGLFGMKMTSRQGRGEPNPNWIPTANDITRRVADKIDGDPRGLYGDVVNRPQTAHFIGGCPIGDSPETSVVDPYQRLYGYEGLHVIDGSAVPANVGANPALTITALSERAVAMWPNKGEPDPRPPLGAAYQQLSPVAPHNPIVPESAPGALRLSAI
jgi:cholesterol oxidase